MEKSAEIFCAKCSRCCHIYLFRNQPLEEVKKKAHKLIFNNDIDQYGVEPLKSEWGRCEFLGENGCIIPREKRPIVCLEWECLELEKFNAGDKDIDPPFKKEDLKKYYK